MKNGMSVRKFLEQNPKATTKAVVRATGASAKTVYSMRWKLKQENKVVDLSAAGSPLRTGKTRMLGCGDNDPVNHPLRYTRTGKIRMLGCEDTPEVDLVNHPPHYTTGGVETIDFIEAKKLNYNLGNVVKYITRADHKGSRIEDLRKAKWYLEREILSAHI